MLAYVFWHRPRRGADRGAYESAQRAFHDSLEMRSASFRLAGLPFDGERDGYEDWYVVEDWSGLGELNAIAVDAVHRSPHDRAAALAADGWGAVYAHLAGELTIPAGAEWFDKPLEGERDEPAASLAGITVWQRQMVLGPGPEFCRATPATAGRERIWPPQA